MCPAVVMFTEKITLFPVYCGEFTFIFRVCLSLYTYKNWIDLVCFDVCAKGRRLFLSLSFSSSKMDLIWFSFSNISVYKLHLHLQGRSSSLEEECFKEGYKFSF